MRDGKLRNSAFANRTALHSNYYTTAQKTATSLGGRGVSLRLGDLAPNVYPVAIGVGRGSGRGGDPRCVASNVALTADGIDARDRALNDQQIDQLAHGDELLQFRLAGLTAQRMIEGAP